MYILAMVFMFGYSLSTPVALSSIQVEYSTEASCENAKRINREAMTKAAVVLATCTKK